MEPSLKDGSIFLVNNWAFLFRAPKIGEVVTFFNPNKTGERLCKRITAFYPGENAYELCGDNQFDSLDSRSFGRVKKEAILGKVLMFTGPRRGPRLG